ncbi:MAG TPA: sodium:solute symporter family protein, partial [Planctomycetaceae bacterium]|nr:sodium:solute symporter family protein [Planctomycetaceae bacterium]
MTVLGIIAGYIAILLCLGLFSSKLFKGTSQDYMLASHSIGPFMLLMSLFGTTMTAFALVGSTGEAYAEGAGVYGLLASSSGIIHSLCFFVLGVKLWSLGKKYGYTTQIQYFRDRLESDKIGVLLFPVLVGMVIPYLLIGVSASGTFINGVTKGTFDPGTFPAFLEEGAGGGVPKAVASFVICLVVLIYVFFGGMRGTAWANTFQTIVFMVLGVVTFYVIAMKLGGEESLMASLEKTSGAIDEEKLTRHHMSKVQFGTYIFIP